MYLAELSVATLYYAQDQLQESCIQEGGQGARISFGQVFEDSDRGRKPQQQGESASGPYLERDTLAGVQPS